MSFDPTNPNHSPDAPLRRMRWIFKELLDRGVPAGQLRSFFDTHAQAWLRYALFTDPDISTDVSNDATHGWLDTVVGGQTVRQHIIDRLSLD